MDAIERCRLLAQFTEETGAITRTFLSAPMHAVHECVGGWMEQAGLGVTVDHAGNIRGVYPALRAGAPRLIIGSHLDTVPHAGAFDGILGVVLGIALIERLDARRLPFAIEVVGFSEEEGVRFGVPFIGSRAFIGDIDDALLARIAPAITDFGLDPTRIGEARAANDALGYLEFHIEQGPVLESLKYPLGVVQAIAGQSRYQAIFSGKAGHAGTTPMELRHDALAGAAEWIATVESIGKKTPDLVATVGRLKIEPGAANVIAGTARASLDVRHAQDAVRKKAAEEMIASAKQLAARRGLTVEFEQRMDQPAVAMNPELTSMLEQAVGTVGHPIHRMTSGAGHDAMVVATKVPAAMLFLRSPGGLSHHPDETVLVEDVEAALAVGLQFLEQWESRHA